MKSSESSDGENLCIVAYNLILKLFVDVYT